MNTNINTQIVRVNINNIEQHPLHKKHNGGRNSDQMKHSMKKMGNKSVNPIVGIPDPNRPDYFSLISGMIRLEGQIDLGNTAVEMLVVTGLKTDKEIEGFVIELNKQKELTIH